MIDFSVHDVHPYAQHAHEVAGHVVGLIFKGWWLREVQLGSINFSTDAEGADTPWRIRHTTPDSDRPFYIFSGVWASAMWLCEHECLSYYEALDFGWDSYAGGFTAEYEGRVEELVARYGSDPDERAWEEQWYEQLEPLWPAVCEVAAMLLDGQQVTHEQVKAVVDRYPIE
jgi:hypothetical protein